MNLFFRKYGEGKPVIILHGLFGMSDNWATIGKQLADNNFSVFIPDQRNHGESPRTDEFNYEILTNDLKEFIIQHSISDPIIIGHSMGGKVAMNYALKNIGSIEKLIIVDIGPKKYNEILDGTLEALISLEIERMHTRSEIESALFDKIKFRRVVQLMMKNVKRIADDRFDWKFNLESIHSNFANISESLNSNQKYCNPVLFISGGLSDYIVEDDISGIRELFSKSEFKVIEGATHWVHADKPLEFLQAVKDYF